MEIGQLRAFVAVAEEASFSRAADRLHLVQSSVSAAVLALERDLGTKLFERGSRRSDLTDAGHILLPEARRVLEAVAMADDAVRQVGSGLRGSVSLGVMQAQAMHPVSIPRLLAGFRDDHPAVEVSVRHVGGSIEMARQVREGRLDLAVLALPEPQLRGLEIRRLAVEAMVLACPEDHPLATRRSVDLAALAEEPFVDFPAGWGTRVAVDLAFAAHGTERQVNLELNDTAGLIEFVRAGLALALLPPSILVGVDDVAQVPIAPDPPTFVTQLAWPAERPQKAAAKALRERLLEQIAATRRRRP
ncbi:MAG TPA: LysR family transcriptional regulator [Solirubrobacterales bacterium]|jgi:DNA-binding transcriptional LysR family regulator|nr:LysR family transcriptional regulator [Solirubrobacterales bacterium]